MADEEKNEEVDEGADAGCGNRLERRLVQDAVAMLNKN